MTANLATTNSTATEAAAAAATTTTMAAIVPSQLVLGRRDLDLIYASWRHVCSDDGGLAAYGVRMMVK